MHFFRWTNAYSLFLSFFFFFKKVSEYFKDNNNSYFMEIAIFWVTTFLASHRVIINRIFLVFSWSASSCSHSPTWKASRYWVSTIPNQSLSPLSPNCIYCVYLKSGISHFTGARCSSMVRAFTHGAMGRRIDPSWGGPIELFLIPASAPQLVPKKAMVCAILSVGWCI